MQPMLAQPVDRVPEGAGWIMEPKWDGWRCVAEVRGSGVVLRTRAGHRITSVPYIEKAIGQIVPADSVLDGEIVDLSSERQWNRVQRICARNAPHHPSSRSPGLTFVVFDLTRLMAEDIRHHALTARRHSLEMLLRRSRRTVVLSPQWPADQRVADALVEQGFEGVVAKRADSPYVENRDPAWRKYKPQHEIEAVCTGTYKGDGGGVGLVFQLESGYEGTVYSGLSLAQQADIEARPDRYIGHVVEILHLGTQASGALLNPTLHRVRSRRDKAHLRVVTEPRTTSRPAGRARVRLVPNRDGTVEVIGNSTGRSLTRCENEEAARERAAEARWEIVS